MRPFFRIYLAVALAMMLTLTGQSMAVARGASGPAGQMVLCTGTGPVSVFVDEDGTPTAPPYFCPDCALGSLAVLALPEMMVLPVAGRVVALRPHVAHVLGIKTRIRAVARAPPHVA